MSTTKQSKIKQTFFQDADLTLAEAQKIVKDALSDTDYGEFYQEAKESETIAKSKGEFVSISFGNSTGGWGFRVGQGNNVSYAYSNMFNRDALERAASDTRTTLKKGVEKYKTPFEKMKDTALYPEADLASGMTPAEKIAKINEIEDFIKTLGGDVENISLSYSASSKQVHIINGKGESLYDSQPRSALAISIQVKGKDDKLETGSVIIGGPENCGEILSEKEYKKAAKDAYEMAQELLKADNAPSGEMEVVLNQGWPGVLLHEAVGHGLEGDFNRRSISVYSGKLGKKIAADKVTVVDQGDIPGMRGSLPFDDEGTPTRKNVLIENGVLKGYMQDLQNAQMMKTAPTGNGRRQSYKHTPMPRMTNTFFAPGTDDPKDIIKKVKYGLYVSKMGGGQVNITSGEFNMNATLAYIIRDGKLCEPVKGAALVGDGLDVIQNILDVGNDLRLEKSTGMCGKNGQSVPAGIGQPTVRIKKMKVGGSKGGPK